MVNIQPIKTSCNKIWHSKPMLAKIQSIYACFRHALVQPAQKVSKVVLPPAGEEGPEQFCPRGCAAQGPGVAAGSGQWPAVQLQGLLFARHCGGCLCRLAHHSASSFRQHQQPPSRVQELSYSQGDLGRTFLIRIHVPERSWSASLCCDLALMDLICGFLFHSMRL